MIDGAHAVISSTDPTADRAFFRDVLEFPHVDAGDGWLIFALPPTELAVHPAERDGIHEFFLMCADVEVFMAEMIARGVAFEPIQDLSWGRLTRIALPGGGRLGVYQPLHPRPDPASTSQ